MSATSMLASRVTAELNMFVNSPPHGVSCWPVGDSITEFEAVIIGPDDTPYEKGHFKVNITLPARYPMEPPRCLFKTKVYHPNIDEGGRICLDILKLPPKGQWKPSLNLPAVLTSLRLLLECPNPDDPLVGHISEQFIADHDSYVRNAKSFTQQYASPNSESAPTTIAEASVEPIPSEEKKVEKEVPSPAAASKPQVRTLGLSFSKPVLSLGKKENRSIAAELDAEFAPPSKQQKTEESVASGSDQPPQAVSSPLHTSSISE